MHLHLLLLLLLLLGRRRARPVCRFLRVPRRRVQQRADFGDGARARVALLALALARRRRLRDLRGVLMRGPVRAGHERRNGGVVRVVRRHRVHVVRGDGREALYPTRGPGRGCARRLEGRGDERAALVRELFGARARVRALEEAALVAELRGAHHKVRGRGKRRRENRLRTTLPGVRLERRQVDVSVVRQL